MSAPIVFFDIAGPDEARLRAFYGAVFDWSCGTPGNFVPGNAPDLQGHIRQDPAEKVIYVGVPDVSAALQRIVEAGGEIDVPRYEVPGVVVLGLFRDPAGNRMGLVEMDGEKPVVP
ncbi:MAG: hypothetical protein AAFR11_10965 [Pseudomonadota bacterium]